jgi:hypothetical protein
MTRKRKARAVLEAMTAVRIVLWCSKCLLNVEHMCKMRNGADYNNWKPGFIERDTCTRCGVVNSR